MNRRFPALALAVAASALLAGAALADDPKPAEPGPWKFGEVLALNLSQSSFSSNWSGGDKGSIVWVLTSATTAERQFSRHFNSATSLALAYGQTSRQVADPADPGRRTWDVPDKTTDQILLQSTGRFTLDGPVDPYFALRAESQFQDQSNPLGTLELNPVRIKESAGIARVLVKRDDAETITRVGFGFRQTFGRTLLSVAPKTTKSFTASDGGFEWQTDVKQPLLQKKVLCTATLLVFQPVLYSRSSALEEFDREALAAYPGREAVKDFWKATNVDLQSTFSAQITKALGVNLFVQWVYDKFDAATNVDNSQPLDARIAEIDRGVRRAGQFKETLALALTYRLF
jgi:hypothetical protein